MSTLSHFHSPANQAPIDFGKDTSGLQKFDTAWNNNLRRWTLQSILGNPWSNVYDDNRNYYFNPLTTDIPNPAPAAITWNPFPNRLYNFFQDPAAPADEQLTDEQIYELADMGAIKIGGVPTPIDKIQVPQTLCPNNDWQGTLIGYTPAGSRGWLDEYCEWSVKRDQNGKLRQVMFACENPAYWFTLWNVSPDLVLQLYQQYVNPAVKRADLYLLDEHNQPVMDPLTGDYAYDPTNKWNRGTVSLPDRGGAMHLSSAPNTLSAEIYLAAAATIARQVGNSDPQTLICCAQYGRPRRNSDPHIGQQANQTAVNLNTNVTLADPVGLYIQTPSFGLWTVKNQPSYPVQNFWSVQRGSADTSNPGSGNDSILHAVFTVPDGMDPEDIMITNVGGSNPGSQFPLTWAGQIVQTFQIALRVNTIPAPQSPPQQPRPCVISMDNSAPNLQPWPVQLLPEAMANAGSPIDLSPNVPRGTSTTMILSVQGGLKNAAIELDPPDGIQPITITTFLPNGPGTPGQTSGGGTQAYIFDLVVDSKAPLGDRNLRVINLDKTQPAGGVPWLPGMLAVVAKSGS